VSHPNSDQPEFDPLLAFTSEPAEPSLAEAPHDIPVQVAGAAVVAAPAPSEPPPSDIIDGLRARIQTLESALEESSAEAAKLRSRVATLVTSSRDIKPRPRRHTAEPLIGPAKTLRPVFARAKTLRQFRAAPAIAGVIFGVVLVVWLWIYLSSPAVDPIVMKAATPVAAPPAEERITAQLAAPGSNPAPAQSPAPPAATAIPIAAPVTRVSTPPTVSFSKGEPRPPARTVSYVGTLTIDSEPGGEVFIDRASAGHTPLRMEKLKAGSHLVWIERDGYRRWTRVVEVPADRVSRVVADLETLNSR